MLKIGKRVPDFELEAYQGGKMKKVRLSDFQGKWVVIVFYPGDFTFVCPTELGELADLYPEFKKAGAEVLSCSTDSVYVHKAWHDESPIMKKVTYPMMADPAGEVAREFGVYLEKAGVALRGSFVIDPDQFLRAYEVHDTKIGRNMAELLRKLQAAEFVRKNKGEVCPVSWKPGEKGMKTGMDLVGKI